MKKNLKQLMLLWILGLWLASTLTSAETKSDCFWIADSEAWFGWAVIINYQCFENVIEIPSTIEGKKVTEIWKWAFKNTVLTTVKLPDTLKQISESAFEDNIIEKIEIPEGVEVVDKYAFKNNKLKAIKLPKSLKTIGDEAFYKNSLEKISVPGRLNKVGENAFCENVGNEVIWVSDSLEWTWKNSCFKLIKASTVEDTYAWIETDFSAEISEKLWDWIKTDSPEVDELTSVLEELGVEDTTSGEILDLSWDISDELEIEDGTGDTEELTGEIEDIESFEDETITEEVSNEESSIGGLSLDSDFLGAFGWSFGSVLAVVSGFFWIISILVLIWKIYQTLLIISTWEIYKKAWKRWWAFLIPIYWTVVYSEIAETNKWLWIIPWLIPLAALWLGFLNLWTMVTFGAIAVLALITIVLCIVWNYRVARRFGWSKFASVLNVLFFPITVLFLWLRNDEYQPKKLSYDLNKPQVNEPEKSVPAPIVASEQLNNVVEHFVWPEEETASESVTEIVNEPVVEPTDESAQTETEKVKEETTTSDEVDLTVKNEEEPAWVSEDIDLSLDSESSEEVAATEIAAPEGSMDNEIDLSNNVGISEEDANSIQLNLDDEFSQLDDTETPIWEIKTEEENEIVLDDQPESEVTASNEVSEEAPEETTEFTETTEANEVEETPAEENNTETILPSLDTELTKDEPESEVIESTEVSEEVPEETIESSETTEANEVEETPAEENNTETILPSLDPELTKDNSEDTESYENTESEEDIVNDVPEAIVPKEVATEPEVQAEQPEETVENEPSTSETQDMWADESFFEDLPQDVVEELYDAEQAAEANETTSEETEDTTEYPSEPISDLDQLMANNNKSI